MRVYSLTVLSLGDIPSRHSIFLWHTETSCNATQHKRRVSRCHCCDQYRSKRRQDITTVQYPVKFAEYHPRPGGAPQPHPYNFIEPVGIVFNIPHVATRSPHASSGMIKKVATRTRYEWQELYAVRILHIYTYSWYRSIAIAIYIILQWRPVHRIHSSSIFWCLYH